MSTLISACDITACVLAGGRGMRMGGVDKGLQLFQGKPLALQVLQRLAPQVGTLLINANRNTEVYAELAKPLNARICADALPDYPGPLAGFLAGLTQCHTEWLLCVPCDTPLFPTDLVAHMVRACDHAEDSDIVVAHGWDSEGESVDANAPLGAQPVFCLMRASLKDSLSQFITQGGRKIDAWTSQHRCAQALFDRPQDLHAFANANTLGQLHDLEQLACAEKP